MAGSLLCKCIFCGGKWLEMLFCCVLKIISHFFFLNLNKIYHHEYNEAYLLGEETATIQISFLMSVFTVSFICVFVCCPSSVSNLPGILYGC